MKIALVSQPLDGVLPPRQNSIGIWTYEVARRLAADWDVTVYLRGDGWRMRERQEHDVRFRLVPMELDRQLYKFTSRLFRSRDPRRPFYAAAHYYLGYAWHVARDLRRQGADIVHVMNFSQFVPVIRALNPRLKIALNMRCEWLSQLDRELVAGRLRRTDLVVGCSNHVTDEVRRRFPEFADRCRTVFNGVDMVDFTTGEGAGRPDAGAGRPTTGAGKRLLFVGRVSPEKGVHVLLDAMAEIVRQTPEAHLEVVGGHSQLPLDYLVGVSDDPRVQALSRFYEGNSRSTYIGRLQEQVRSLGLADHVTFTGSLPYAEVADRYRNADLLINPSFSESFGRSLVEAMSCEVPVVASRIGGMLDCVADGETGLLCEPGDAGDLARAILRLLADDEARQRMGRAARQRVNELFSWESVVTDLKATYTRELASDG